MPNNITLRNLLGFVKNKNMGLNQYSANRSLQKESVNIACQLLASYR